MDDSGDLSQLNKIHKGEKKVLNVKDAQVIVDIVSASFQEMLQYTTSLQFQQTMLKTMGARNSREFNVKLTECIRRVMREVHKVDLVNPSLPDTEYLTSSSESEMDDEKLSTEVDLLETDCETKESETLVSSLDEAYCSLTPQSQKSKSYFEELLESSPDEN